MASGTFAACSSALLALAAAAACGSSNQAAQSPTPASTATDAGVVDAQVPHPFAGSVIEAQTLIQDQIDGRMKVLWKCVDAYRTTVGDPHKGVVVDVGIDQEGTLLGVTTPSAKLALDPTLKQCLFDGLHGLPYPRSHAGVITVRQTFKDEPVSP
jgi:hypothetical protein